MESARTRIICMIPVWKRPEITRLCYAGLHRIDSRFSINGITFVPLIIYSEPEHGQLARENGFLSCYSENLPLGRKLNNGLRECVALKWDYFMQMGSDDLLTDAAVDAIIDYIRAGHLFFGFDELLVASYSPLRMLRTRAGHVFGAGRVIHRRILEKAANVVKVKQLKGQVGPGGRFAPGAIYYVTRIGPNQRQIGERQVHLWDDDKNVGLDGDSETKLMIRAKALPTIVRLPAPGVVDIKGPDNIHSFDKLAALESTEEVPWTRVVPELKTVEGWEG